MMRRISRILKLGKNLEQQLNGGNAEITKAAQSLSEFTELWEPESDLLAGISAVEAEKKLFRQARADVERSADVMLTCGLETKSQSQIGTALQVYFNLGLLATKMGQVLNEKIKEVQVCLKDCFDVKKIEAAVFDQLPASALAKVTKSRLFSVP